MELNFSVINLLMKSGYTIFVLIICSVLSLKVIVEKYIALKCLNRKFNEAIALRINHQINKNDIPAAMEELGLNKYKWWFFTFQSPMENIFRYILKNKDKGQDFLLDRSLTKLDIQVVNLEKGLNILATLGSISPFIGLFGTVVGIIRAFDSLSGDMASGYTNVMAGISEALISTAAGLLVAIPAVLFYNSFIKKIKNSIPFFEDTIYETVSNITGIKGQK
jgi:biopolymer transport protein ExbB/TolQ